MEITEEFIDMVAPKHDRTSCNDENNINGGYDFEEKTLQGIVVERRWRYRPRCNRCYLLNHIGDDTNGPIIEVIPSIELRLSQPKVKITVEELE